MRWRLIALGSLFILATGMRALAQESYDLGGPCRDERGLFSREIAAAEKSQSWDRLIDLEKAQVRGGCDIEYRWQKLVDALLQASRVAEAVRVLQEMDRRGFDLNPALIGRMSPRLEKFMDGPIFRASPVGVTLEQLRKVSDARRLRFRRLLELLPANQKPPVNYIAKGACPFECCLYGKWTVREDTDLVASPGSARVVGRAKKGSPVRGVTGEVHLKPEPVVVVGGELPKDTIAFILDYGGEGFGNVYTRGKIVSIFLGYEKYCFRLSEYCWGEALFPSAEKMKRVWWIKVKLPNGITGWTVKAENFDGKDGCA